MVVNERFPVLSFIAKVLWSLGLLIAIIGVIFLGAEIIEYLKMSKPDSEWVWSAKDVIKLAIGTICTPLGLITMAIAEIIGVLFAIEKNTRTT